MPWPRPFRPPLDSTMTAATRIAFAACVLATLARAPVAHADVYKCAGDKGVPIYRNALCEGQRAPQLPA
jgi:hypothetical protein